MRHYIPKRERKMDCISITLFANARDIVLSLDLGLVRLATMDNPILPSRLGRLIPIAQAGVARVI